MVLEYDNLGLYVRFSNSGYYLTEYLDEATTFNRCGTAMIQFIDNQLLKSEIPFYQKGKLVLKEV